MEIGAFGVSGYQAVLFRAQGSSLWRMHLFSRAPNMRGKYFFGIGVCGQFCIVMFRLHGLVVLLI